MESKVKWADGGKTEKTERKRDVVAEATQRQNLMEMATTLQMQHGSYLCPGLHTPGSRMDIHIADFTEMLGPECGRIVIPLFQRTYCWEKQIPGWWRDLTTKAAMGHRVGKIIVKVSPSLADEQALICIDGQQRITSLSLVLATLRDAALRERAVLSAEDARAVVLDTTTARLERYLFHDLEAWHRWVDQAAERGARCPLAHGEGVDIGFSKLVPSFVDRGAFFELITAGRVAERAGQDGHPEYTEGTRRTCAGRAKGYFDAAVDEYLNAAEAGGRCRAQTLSTLTGYALRGMTLARTEILTPINFAQVFLWFQEKSLFSMAALLHNPSPGEKFNACDLVRNLILSTHMNKSLDEQEDLYRKLWLFPLEKRFPSTKAMDAMLSAFIDSKPAPKTASKFESTGKMAEGMGFPMEDGCRLYGRFVSYYEEIAQMPAEADPAALEAHTAAINHSLNQDIIAFAQTYQGVREES
eukprot:CAMPEP_0119126336 /NCGR_PEP_ID=MMETSP1310-20130426/5301_1 /TAXON_ID=464262 /ORGANISM="Genus nov. species nov., Strain RCC2339" /LENGTH=469 /DNA_ID=CAMNT_0007116489 /DNA_START=141 /DNA_END=1550 /DNA_ORIENTATION=-